jgi:hypothetical protein
MLPENIHQIIENKETQIEEQLMLDKNNKCETINYQHG